MALSFSLEWKSNPLDGPALPLKNIVFKKWSRERERESERERRERAGREGERKKEGREGRILHF